MVFSPPCPCFGVHQCPEVLSLALGPGLSHHLTGEAAVMYASSSLLPAWCPGVLLVAACSPLLKDDDGLLWNMVTRVSVWGSDWKPDWRAHLFKTKVQGWVLWAGLRWGHCSITFFKAVFLFVYGRETSHSRLDPRIRLRLFAASQTQSLTFFPFSCYPPCIAPWHSRSPFTHKQCLSFISSPIIGLFIRKSTDIINHMKAIYPPLIGKISFLRVCI